MRKAVRFPGGWSVRRWLVVILVWAATVTAGHALEVTPDLLFQQMEESTEKIHSLVAEVELSSGTLQTFVTLSIQSPDKFAMHFQNDFLRVVFDGEKLWLYIASLAEVFTLDASGGGWLSESLREWVNPREIVTRITRQTLFSFFDVALIDTATLGSVTADLGLATATIRAMRFQPLTGSVFKQVFEVGYYHLVFSMETFLPVLVQEFSPEGSLRGTLKVLRYRINEPIPRDRFVFEVPPGVVQVPLTTVLAQKLEQGKNFLVEKVGEMFDRMRRKLTDWGL
ncbi:MAG: hypothetical protein GX442_17210 [Candidatus Riflebacteria bacterium]|nr:hypothetical protein [Candidatus Riflebacteria bacterium]